MRDPSPKIPFGGSVSGGSVQGPLFGEGSEQLQHLLLPGLEALLLRLRERLGRVRGGQGGGKDPQRPP